MKPKARSSTQGFMTIVVGLALCGAVAKAAVITASDITIGSSIHVTGDGHVTLTPYAAGLTLGTFGAGSNFFGVVGNGNDNNVRDADGNPATTADREAIDMTLDATVGLSEVSFIWARADGPAATDGIVISGFLADPGASTTSGVGITYNAGTIYLNYAWDAGVTRTFSFSNLDASKGQTLRFSANDSNQTNAQFAFNTITYVPEPSAALLGGLGLLALLRRRR